VFGRLAEARVGVAAASASLVDGRIDALDARINAQRAVVADFERRVAQVDGAPSILTDGDGGDDARGRQRGPDISTAYGREQFPTLALFHHRLIVRGSHHLLVLPLSLRQVTIAQALLT